MLKKRREYQKIHNIKVCMKFGKRLETVFPVLKLPQSYYINIDFGTLSPSHIPCQKDNPHNWTN